MNWINKLERRFGRYAIPNLMKYIAGIFCLGLILGSFMPDVLFTYLSLDFGKVLQGQVWRLVTFIIPYSNIRSIIFFAISTYFYYMIGNSLEQNWGAFRLNLYFFSGVILNLIGYLIIYLITGVSFPAFDSMGLICSTMFFAFAALYPDVQFYIYFLIPVKAKYMAVLEGVIYLYYIYNYISGGAAVLIIPLVLTFGNFLLFFFGTRNYRRISPREIKRKTDYRRQMQDPANHGTVTQFRGKNVVTRHKCAVCGRTELDGEDLEFRFCSKCDGNYEYCMDHLFTHEHVTKR